MAQLKIIGKTCLFIFVLLWIPSCQTTPTPIAGESELAHKLPEAGQNNFWYLHTTSDTVIIFIHGFNSNSRSAWLYTNRADRTKDVYWPTLVQTDNRLKDASIYLAGYYSDIDSGNYDIRQAADDIFSALNRPDPKSGQRVMDKRNLLFVTHSMGGLIALRMLDRHSDDFLEKRLGLLLFASPSFGSTWANYLSLLESVYGSRMGQQLQVNSEFLYGLDRDFKSLLAQKKLRIEGLEGCEHHFVVHRWWWPFPFQPMITEESCSRYFGPSRILAGTDHSSVVKPDGLQHPSHAMLVDFFTNKFEGLILREESVEKQPRQNIKTNKPHFSIRAAGLAGSGLNGGIGSQYRFVGEMTNDTVPAFNLSGMLYATDATLSNEPYFSIPISIGGEVTSFKFEQSFEKKTEKGVESYIILLMEYTDDSNSVRFSQKFFWKSDSRPKDGSVINTGTTALSIEEYEKVLRYLNSIR